MSDLISRQAAIDAVLDRMDTEKHGRNAKPEEIKWTLERVPSAQPEKVCIANITLSEEQIREAVEKAKEELKNSPILIEPEQRWIPCSEPPTEHGFYHEILLYGKDGNYAVGWYDEDYFTWDDRFDMDTPVAWCELPEPWKGEE